MNDNECTCKPVLSGVKGMLVGQDPTGCVVHGATMRELEARQVTPELQQLSCRIVEALDNCITRGDDVYCVDVVEFRRVAHHAVLQELLLAGVEIKPRA